MAYGKRRASGQVSGDEIVVEAAWLYYHDGLNQNEIADRLDVSRATVVNYLQEAREKNYIRVTMAPDVFMGHSLANQLRDKFGLKAAFIVPNGLGDVQSRLTRAARGAAEWLPDLVVSGDKLGVAWGQTIFEMAEILVSSANVTIPNVEVAQLVGSMATPYGFTAEICSAHLAQGLGAACVNLHAPAIVTNPELARQLREEPIIKKQLSALEHCNKAVFAAGSVKANSHVVMSGIATEKDLKTYVNQGACGVLCGRFINEDGKPV
uniref:sugar-binding transcriptional regulator n=1 Tax=uncultured Maritalea sp. TaxID=757249 RepID=UPI00262C2A25